MLKHKWVRDAGKAKLLVDLVARYQAAKRAAPEPQQQEDLRKSKCVLSPLLGAAVTNRHASSTQTRSHRHGQAHRQSNTQTWPSTDTIKHIYPSETL